MAAPLAMHSYGKWQEQSKFAEPPLSLEGVADHW
jgi:hypothetical protein